MALGPGKYDDLAQMVHFHTRGHMVLVAVVGGTRGHGFSVITEGGVPNTLKLADMLETIAKQLRADMQKLEQ